MGGTEPQIRLRLFYRRSALAQCGPCHVMWWRHADRVIDLIIKVGPSLLAIVFFLLSPLYFKSPSTNKSPCSKGVAQVTTPPHRHNPYPIRAAGHPPQVDFVLGVRLQRSIVETVIGLLISNGKLLWHLGLQKLCSDVKFGTVFLGFVKVVNFWRK